MVFCPYSSIYDLIGTLDMSLRIFPHSLVCLSFAILGANGLFSFWTEKFHSFVFKTRRLFTNIRICICLTISEFVSDCFFDYCVLQVYFWSLPSRAGNQLRLVRAKLESDHATLKQRESELDGKLESSKDGRDDSDERQAALTELNAMEKKHRELQEEIKKYAESDPAVYEAMSKLSPSKP
ncbi:hypothetical protein KC19_VG274700 [Ceratodon purpureus]|uniref:Uncharacterized protein n=1 Tax=Ceratodon purpureus TaxID=3225 RepID=A0A8T0HU75_CERPU|nr:hypothetical protein KC19_VG274700 [Ceratodon purpureus]